jgi:hypothetical protein
MSLESKSKKELVEIISELKNKVKELKPVEASISAKLDDLEFPAVGLHKNENGEYQVVKIKYDLEKNAAAIEALSDEKNKDVALAYQSINKIIEQMVRKARGGKYDK